MACIADFANVSSCGHQSYGAYTQYLCCTSALFAGLFLPEMVKNISDGLSRAPNFYLLQQQFLWHPVLVL
jgi:hypothetical protein